MSRPLGVAFFIFVALLFGGVFGGLALEAQETTKEGDSSSPISETVAYALQGGGGVWASWQENYGVLPQSHSQFMLEVSRGEPWRIALSMGFLFAQPSAVSPFWYRYRGFWAAQFGLGYSYKGKMWGEWPLTLGVRGSLALAQYTYSDSYFFFPQVEVQTEFLTLPLHPRWEATLSGTLSYLLRRDIYNVGGGLMVTLRWYPWKKEKPLLPVSAAVQENGALAAPPSLEEATGSAVSAPQKDTGEGEEPTSRKRSPVSDALMPEAGLEVLGGEGTVFSSGEGDTP